MSFLRYPIEGDHRGAAGPEADPLGPEADVSNFHKGPATGGLLLDFFLYNLIICAPEVLVPDDIFTTSPVRYPLLFDHIG